MTMATTKNNDDATNHNPIQLLPRGLGQLTCDATTWKGQSLLSVSQLTCDGFHLLYRLARRMRDLVQRHRSGSQVCRHNVLATIFFEASTRTSCSFQVAMLRLGGQVVHVDASGNTATTTANRAGGNSSVVKGESLSDTLRCLECYVDITVVRHYQTGALLEVAPHINKPMINAGDGIGEHPTQALLDAFTILDEIPLSTNNSNNNKKNSSNKLVVIMLGDLKHGRTVHSLAKLLAQIMPGMNMTIDLRYVAPPGLEMPKYLQEQLQQSSSFILQSNASSLNETILQNVDIIYVTRVQKERFESMEDYERAKGTYVVNKEVLSRLDDHVRILHPLPRVDEICTDCDDDPRAAYFRQMENGMYVRMALLTLLLGKLEEFDKEQRF